ncbi:hypothetical protein KCP70_20095 [Salmonella enterica subsp. enterica]|nr:hypothetical protein KCP70_20095 [Salmonella enterica subsp. enterica]
MRPICGNSATVSTSMAFRGIPLLLAAQASRFPVGQNPASAVCRAAGHRGSRPFNTRACSAPRSPALPCGGRCALRIPAVSFAMVLAASVRTLSTRTGAGGKSGGGHQRDKTGDYSRRISASTGPACPPFCCFSAGFQSSLTFTSNTGHQNTAS